MRVKLSYREYDKKQFFELMVKRARSEVKRFPLPKKVALFDDGSELVPVASWLLEQCHVDFKIVKRRSNATLFMTCGEDEAAARLRLVLYGTPFPKERRFMRTFILEEIRMLSHVLRLNGNKHFPDPLFLEFEKEHPGTVFGLLKSMHQIESLRSSKGKS